MTTTTLTKAGALVTAAGIALAGLASCSDADERNVGNFCSTVGEHRDEFNSAMSAVTSSGDISAGLSQASDAFAGLGDMWSRLATVAPEDIRADAETMDAAFGTDSGRATETTGSDGILSGITDAVDTANAAVNVNTYVTQHCS